MSKSLPRLIGKKLLRFFLWLILGLVALAVLISLAIQIPSVQNYLVDKITHQLSKSLNTEVSIGEVNFDFFSSLELRDVLALDQHGDTLLYTGLLRGDIGLFSLLGKEVFLDEVRLENVYLNIHSGQSPESYNYQFLLNAFPADTTGTATVIDTSAAPWTIGLGKTSIHQLRLNWQDTLAGFQLQSSITHFLADLRQFSLADQQIDIDEVELHKGNIRFTQFTENYLPVDTAVSPLVFPYPGWDITANSLLIDDVAIRYDDRRSPPVNNMLDYSHLQLDDLQLQLNDFEWNAEQLTAEIEKLQVKDHSGLEIQQLSTQFRMQPDLIQLKDLQIQTPQSNIQNNTTLKFNEFNDLNDFLNQVHFDAAFDNSEIAMSDLSYFIPDSLNLYRGDEKLMLTGSISGQAGRLDLKNLEAKLGNTIQLTASGQLENITETEKLAMNIELQQLRANYAALRRNVPMLALPPGGEQLGNIRISGKAKGTLQQLDIGRLLINTDASTKIAVQGKLQNLTNIDKMEYTLDIQELYSTIADVAGFIPDSSRAQLELFDYLQYSGQLNGTFTDIYSKGQLITGLGELTTDAHINFNADYSNATYEGQIDLDDFELGKFLQDTLGIGNASLTATLNGRGLTLDSLITEVDATILSIVFNQYNYKNLLIKGKIDRQKFIGNLDFNDPNLVFDFTGEVDINGETPVYQFTANLDTVDLMALNLYPDPLRLSMQIDVDFEGSELDNFLGRADIKNIWISNDTAAFYMDSLLVKADFMNTNEKRLTISSEIMRAWIEGDYYLADLPRLSVNFINDYFPVDQLISPVDKPARLAIEPGPQDARPDQSFRFQISLDDPIRLTQFFTDQLTYLDTALIVGSFNSRDKLLELDATTPRLAFAGSIADSLRLSVRNDIRKIDAKLTVPLYRSGNLIFKNNNIDAGFYNDSLSIAFELHDDRDSLLLATAADISMLKDTYQLYFTKPLSLNGESWAIESQHKIGFTSTYLDIDNLSFSKGRQIVTIDSRDKPTDKDLAPIEIAFANFEIAEINDLVDMGGVQPSGEMNGTILLNEIQTNLHYIADVEVDSLKLNGEDAGKLIVRASQEAGEQKLQVFTSLKGAQNDLLAEGHYDLNSNTFDIKADIREVKMALLDPFLSGFIKDSKGQLSGDFKLTGTAAQPFLNGKLHLQNASTFVEYLQTAYTIADHTITVNNERVDFGNMRLQDDAGNAATLSGYVAHTYFSDFQLNLDFNTDKFKILNTASKDNELFYGMLFVDARVTIRGSIELPQITVNARTLDNSQLFVMALAQSQAIIQEDYIIFGTPEALPLDSALNVNNRLSTTPAIDLLLNLEVTNGLELVIIVDPVSGDQLKTKGNASITMRMDKTGETDILGVYTISSGSYDFSYEGLIKRKFIISRGSRINFVGDPYDTRFDVTAAYRTRTSTYELIKNQTSLSQAEVSNARQRSDVEVQLKIKGDLDQPELSFDIQMVSDNFSDANTAVERKLARLREDPNELNKQVFGLMLLNSFIAEESASASLSTAGENIALSSVSSLISNQLNRLAGNYIKGVNLSFDIESYRSQFSDQASANTVTNLNIGLSKSLLNDRLSIKVGTDLQVNNGSNTEQSSANYSSIAGDFVLEYQLTKSGNYLLRVFRRSDYDALNESNVSKTGVGISFNKSFGK